MEIRFFFHVLSFLGFYHAVPRRAQPIFIESLRHTAIGGQFIFFFFFWETQPYNNNILYVHDKNVSRSSISPCNENTGEKNITNISTPKSIAFRQCNQSGTKKKYCKIEKAQRNERKWTRSFSPSICATDSSRCSLIHFQPIVSVSAEISTL